MKRDQFFRLLGPYRDAVEIAFRELLGYEDPKQPISRRAVRDVETFVRRPLTESDLRTTPITERRIRTSCECDEFKVEVPDEFAVHCLNDEVIVLAWSDRECDIANINGEVDEEAQIDHPGTPLATVFLERNDLKYVVSVTLRRDALVEYCIDEPIEELEVKRSIQVTVWIPQITSEELAHQAQMTLSAS